MVVNHQYDPFNEGRVLDSELSKLRGGYLVIEFRDGRSKHHMVSQATILKSKACAQTAKIWNKWPLEQVLKTIYRNAHGRRVIPVDPLVEKRIVEVTRNEDVLLDNDPSRVIESKAQPKLSAISEQIRATNEVEGAAQSTESPAEESPTAVSYTHLTLPTIYSV